MDNYVCTLNDQAIQFSKDNLGENEEEKASCLNEIREWLAENQQLKAHSGTYSLLMFLRTTKFKIDSTKKRMESFYRLKATTPEWFTNRDPLLPEIQSLLKTGVFLPLLKRDAHGRLIVLIRTAAHNPETQSQNDVFKVGLMTLDVALLDEDTSVYGVVAIFDMQGINQNHAAALSINMIRKAVTSWQVYPVRIEGLKFINSPSYINVVLNVFRSFMTTKLKQKIHIHGDSRESLYNIVPKEILPREYGGEDGSLQNLIDYWNRRVTESRNWLQESEKYKAFV